MNSGNVEQVSSGASLLIVDDSPANLQLLTAMLKYHGYKVRPTPRGELALEAARQSPPDLVLLDIDMPDMNGYEVCMRLKADPNLKSVPVIFISALDGAFDKVKAFSVGGVDYVTKPFQFEEVEARVRTHLTLRSQEKQLESSLAKLQELERMRDSLIHMIVHDMRSPLSAIRLFMELLLKNPLPNPATLSKLTQAANRATIMLGDMTSQLLDINRLEAGQMPIKKESNDLALTLHGVMESIHCLAGERRIHMDSPASLIAVYDHDIVNRVVANLIANAIKFTPPNGEIKLAVSRIGCDISISVSDNGRGIPPEFHSKIFEKFGQVEIQNKRIGTGLGLTFCRLAVEAHGGRIGVESAVGMGSTFWFTLPDQALSQG